jgi:hypothetical protein
VSGLRGLELSHGSLGGVRHGGTRPGSGVGDELRARWSRPTVAARGGATSSFRCGGVGHSPITPDQEWFQEKLHSVDKTW